MMMIFFHIFQNRLFSKKLKQCCSQLASLSVSVFFILPVPAHLLHSPTAVLLHTNMMRQNSLFVLQHTTCRSAAQPTAAFSFPTQTEIQVSNDIKKQSIPTPISCKARDFRYIFMWKAKVYSKILLSFQVVEYCEFSTHFYITCHD